LYLILLDAPPPEHATVAAIGDPVYVCGELVTDAEAEAAVLVEMLTMPVVAAK
jgi:hypothetical protein